MIKKIPYKSERKKTHLLAQILACFKWFFFHVYAIRGFCYRNKNQHKKVVDRELRVAFIVIAGEMWNSIRTVYEECERNARIKTVLIALSKTEKKAYESSTNIYDYLLGRGYTPTDAYKDGQLFDLKSWLPDIIFIQFPYQELYPPKYKIKNLSKYAKVCYIPYGFDTSPDKHLYIEYGNRFLSYVYAIFNDNTFTKLFCEKLIKRNLWYTNIRLIEKGYPRFDFIETNAYDRKKCKSFLWIPRWSVDSINNDATSFFAYKDCLIDYFEQNQEINLIIRPHPKMFLEFKNRGLLSESDIKCFKEYINGCGNIFLDENVDYYDTFMMVDAIIADFSSLDIEFFVTGKPLLYCGSYASFFDEMNYITSTFYEVNTKTELIRGIEMLVRGDDYLVDKRKKAIKEFLNDCQKNAGIRIVESLFDL